MIALGLALALTAVAQDGSAIGAIAVDGRCERLMVLGDDVSQPIDRIFFVHEGRDPAVADGEGVCTFGNPYAGPTTVRCRISTSEGVSEGVFVTDGATPRHEQL